MAPLARRMHPHPAGRRVDSAGHRHSVDSCGPPAAKPDIFHFGIAALSRRLAGIPRAGRVRTLDSEALVVVGRLYAAATGEEGWDECLCRLADFCGATNAALVRADLRAGNSSVIAPRADPAVIA